MPESDEIIGVIPARKLATRFPGKILVSLCGRPLLWWVIDRARQARSLQRVIVATDDQEIFDSAEEAGAEAMMTDAGHPSGTDRVAEVAARVGCDIAINIQGDEPLVEPSLIDTIARQLSEDDAWDMATAATPITDPSDLASTSIVKVVCDRSGSALYFSRACIPHNRDGTGKPAYRRHVGLYGYRASFLQRLVATPPCELEVIEKLEQLRALYIGCRMKVIQAEHAGIGIDVPEDIARAEEMLLKLGLETDSLA